MKDDMKCAASFFFFFHPAYRTDSSKISPCNKNILKQRNIVSVIKNIRCVVKQFWATSTLKQYHPVISTLQIQTCMQ
jgi:hypothetical protein